MDSSFGITVEVYDGVSKKPIKLYSPQKEKFRRCLFCDEMFSISNLHPSHEKTCGPRPRWCRSCNYYFSSYAKILNSDLIKRIRNTKRTAGKAQTCKWCGKSFNLLKNFYSIGTIDYSGFVAPNLFTLDWMIPKGIDFLYPNLYVAICPECFRSLFYEKYSQQPSDYTDAVRDLGLWLGKLPTARMHEHIYDAHSVDEIETFISILKRLPTLNTVKCQFGSFFSLLAQSGLLMDGCRRLRLGTQCLSKDNHLCFSLVEREIDDWLYTRKIKHQKEVFYPESNMRCDWEIIFSEKRFFVEYFGLMSNEAYAKKVLLKQALAKKHNIHLIPIFPNDDWKSILSNTFLS